MNVLKRVRKSFRIMIEMSVLDGLLGIWTLPKITLGESAARFTGAFKDRNYF